MFDLRSTEKETTYILLQMGLLAFFNLSLHYVANSAALLTGPNSLMNLLGISIYMVGLASFPGSTLQLFFLHREKKILLFVLQVTKAGAEAWEQGYGWVVLEVYKVSRNQVSWG